MIRQSFVGNPVNASVISIQGVLPSKTPRTGETLGMTDGVAVEKAGVIEGEAGVALDSLGVALGEGKASVGVLETNVADGAAVVGTTVVGTAVGVAVGMQATKSKLSIKLNTPNLILSFTETPPRTRFGAYTHLKNGFPNACCSEISSKSNVTDSVKAFLRCVVTPIQPSIVLRSHCLLFAFRAVLWHYRRNVRKNCADHGLRRFALARGILARTRI